MRHSTVPLFDAGEVIDRPAREAAAVKVSQSDDLVTGIAGAALWGPLLDRLGLVDEADRRLLRPIGPGGYSGGECYRAVVEVILAGGDVVSDRSLLGGRPMSGCGAGTCCRRSGHCGGSARVPIWAEPCGPRR